MIHRPGRGNPNIEELTRAVTVSGAAPDNAVWTLCKVLMTRIERLPEEQRRSRAASVLGRAASSKALDHVGTRRTWLPTCRLRRPNSCLSCTGEGRRRLQAR